jgi:hypothetical protein
VERTIAVPSPNAGDQNQPEETTMKKKSGTPGSRAGSRNIANRIVAIREQWHTKNHPFFKRFGEGKLPLRAMGLYMGQHYKFVTLVLPSFGYLFTRAPGDVRSSIIENLAEEAGLAAIQREGHKPHDHAGHLRIHPRGGPQGFGSEGP